MSNSSNYNISRQDDNTTYSSNQYSLTNGLDNNSVAKFLEYNHNVSNNLQTPEFFNQAPANSSSNLSYIDNLPNSSKSIHTEAISSINGKVNPHSQLNNSTDGKFYPNPLKYSLSTSSGKNSTMGSDFGADLGVLSTKHSPVENTVNISHDNKFKDLKSPNLNFLSSDKNVRLLDKVNANKSNFNFGRTYGLNQIFDSTNNESDLLKSSDNN
jgi:hypothetical protein